MFSILNCIIITNKLAVYFLIPKSDKIDSLYNCILTNNLAVYF